jgi:hypothetical protein
MPLHVQKKGSKYVVTDPAGKEFGTHSTKQKAIDQIVAIEISKKSKGVIMDNTDGVKLVAQERINVLAGELGTSHGVEMPAAPITILSDGTSAGTVVMLNGQVVEFDSFDIYCDRGNPEHDYPASCSMSITMREKGEDGVEVRRTLTLRKEEESKGLAVKKSDPKAKVRNRGNVVFSSTHAKVTDNKDHFPINDADQARNALARVAQFSAAPKWWSGSLKQLQAAVRSAVSKKFKGIKVTK